MTWEDALKLVSGKLEEWLKSFTESLPNIGVAFLLLIIFLLLARLLRDISKKILKGVVKNEAIENLLASLVFTVVFISGIFISLGILNLNKTVTSLLAGAGILGLALSFAFQDVAQNFISGVSLAIARPFSIGDTIETSGRRGIVKKLSLRTTVLVNSAGELVIIPNKEIHQTVLINSSMAEGVLIRISFNVSNTEDPERVRQLVISTLEMQTHILNKSVEFFFTQFTGAAIAGEARFFINRGEDDDSAKSKAIIALKKIFDSNQIKMT